MNAANTLLNFDTLGPVGSYGQVLGPAMNVQTVEQAREYVDAYLAWRHKHGNTDGKTDEELRSVLMSNLGYYAGYYSNETRARVERLFRCAHPVFGAIADNGAPTAAEAFAVGVRAGSGD